MKTTEIARRANQSAWIILTWSRMELLKPSINCVEGYQRITKSKLARVEFFLLTKWLGFPQHGIADIFNIGNHRKTTQVSIL
jgi:DNA-binding transcriptional MerR regulator